MFCFLLSGQMSDVKIVNSVGCRTSAARFFQGLNAKSIRKNAIFLEYGIEKCQFCRMLKIIMYLWMEKKLYLLVRLKLTQPQLGICRETFLSLGQCSFQENLNAFTYKTMNNKFCTLG
jgi:hypothetical protein